MLLEMLSYAYKNTIYYNKLFKLNDIDISSIDSLPKIPVLTKDIIRNNLSLLISKKFKIDSLHKRNTGGSTGEPLEFYSDIMSGYRDNAHHWYLYSLMGYVKGDVIIGSGGTKIPKSLRDENIYWIRGSSDSVWGEYDFSVLYITDSNIKYYLNKIIDIRPAILRGYPLFFDRLATYILDNNITFDFVIKGINLTAEMCTIQQRENIEKAFCSMIYFEYGHSEISLYCYTHDKSYIYTSSPIYGYIEVIKDNGKYADAGEVGNIIVTGFNNYGMPFIRYDTGDRGEVLINKNGIVKFKNIHGRSQDYILSKTNQKVFLTALIFGQHFNAFKNIRQWQLEQNVKGVVQVNIIKNKLFNDSDEMEICDKFKSVVDIDIEFNYVNNIPLTARGKHLFLIQNIKQEL